MTGEVTRAVAGVRLRIVVMGVSASGKSSVGVELSTRLHLPFTDADTLHPEANIAKMASGTPLEDNDRWPWLDAVAATLVDPDGAIVACSALKRSYRDRLRVAAPDVVFVHLTGSADLLKTRAQTRENHFMPAALLRSQLDALEPLGDDEAGVAIDVDESVADIAQTALEWMDAHER